MLEEIASHSTWKIIAARSPLFLKLFGRAGKKSTVTHLYLKCWKKSSAFHCRCHFLKQWTDINDYCLKKSTVIYPCPHCWLKIHCVHQTTIHRTDHYCRNPPLFPLLEKIQGYTLFISVAAKMPLLFIVKSMTGRNLSSSTNKSLWRKTRKELNSRPFLSLREQRKPSETKRVPFQVRSEAWSIKRPSFWSKCSKTWHHRFPPYIFLLFSCSLIIGWTECKRQYEQRGSMPVGAWWRSAAKCIVVNQQLHGSKSKQWVAMLEDIHHHTFFSWANTKISTVWETTNQFTIASTDEIEHCVCFFSSADFWRDCHLHNCVHKVPPQYPWDPILAAMVRGQNFFQWENHVEEMEVWPPFVVTENGYLKKLARFQKNKEFGNFNQNLKFGKPTSGKNCKKLWLPHHCGDWCLLGAQLSDGFSFIFPVAWTEKSKSAKWNQIQEKTISFYDQQKKKTNPFQVPFELKSWPEVGLKTAMNWNTQSACVV